MIEGAIVLGLVAAISTKFVDFSKYVKAGDRNGALTQVYAWFVGVVFTVALAKSGLAEDLFLPFSELPFSKYGTIAQILVGLSPGSLGGVFVDAKKAIDNTDSAKVPSLF